MLESEANIEETGEEVNMSSVNPNVKLNNDKGLRNYQKSEKKGCRYYFSKLDYEILRPLLIYNYDRERMHKQAKFVEIVNED